MAGFTRSSPSELQQHRALQKAVTCLGIDPGSLVTPTSVRVKFAELVKTNHPDTGEVAPDFDLSAVRKAKALLLKHLESIDA